MEEAQCAGLLHHTASRERKGVGLMNTDRRLRKRYGSGLSIVSRPGWGTAVSFSVHMQPVQELKQQA
ncbi:hypothetical protein D3C86_2231830 [compost metagenome]